MSTPAGTEGRIRNPAVIVAGERIECIGRPVDQIRMLSSPRVFLLIVSERLQSLAADDARVWYLWMVGRSSSLSDYRGVCTTHTRLSSESLHLK